MHPNSYLRTFWRKEVRPEVFVAMSFAGALQQRFEDVIRPAIESIVHRGRKLKANRVDLSQTGDSILTDIVDGIAHSELVLADVSTIGYDAKTGDPYRNGNVMYEVGIALACRHSAEVLLIRDDAHKFLFDVSTVPHKHIDFTDPAAATATLERELEGRLAERDHLLDARLLTTAAQLTTGERKLLKGFAGYGPGKTFWLTKTGIGAHAVVTRLLDKQLIVTVGVTAEGHATFMWTRLGYVLATNLDKLAHAVTAPPVDEAAGEESNSDDA